jgi:GTPase SAR1 family protein
VKWKHLANKIGIVNFGSLNIGQFIYNLTTPFRDNHEKVLLEISKSEVDKRLAGSLHRKIFIDLGIWLHPEKVDCPLDAEIIIGIKSPQILPIGTSIIEVFDHKEINGKLLILGNPGSGKTTLLITLAEFLVERARQEIDYPIPILLNLASWRPNQSISDWIVEELDIKHGVGKLVSAKLLDDRRLLPMLDGLDELAINCQESCVRAINEFSKSKYQPLHLVVCSRSKEYDNYKTQLELNGAIHLQALTDSQIETYLVQVQNKSVWHDISTSPIILDLVRTPFLLSILVMTAQEISMSDWQEIETEEEQLHYLLGSYVEKMSKRSVRNIWYAQENAPSDEKLKLWLSCLAQQLNREFQTEFLIEKIQPSWLPSLKLRLIYPILVLTIIIFLSGIFLGSGRIDQSFSIGIFYALIIGFTTVVGPKVLSHVKKNEEKVKAPWRNLSDKSRNISFEINISAIIGFLTSLAILCSSGHLGIVILGIVEFSVIVFILNITFKKFSWFSNKISNFDNKTLALIKTIENPQLTGKKIVWKVLVFLTPFIVGIPLLSILGFFPIVHFIAALIHRGGNFNAVFAPLLGIFLMAPFVIIIAFTSWLIIHFSGGISIDIKTVENLSWSWRKSLRRFFIFLSFFMFIGVSISLVICTIFMASGFSAADVGSTFIRLTACLGVFPGLFLGLLAFFNGGLEFGTTIEKRNSPNQGMKKSALAFIIITPVSTILCFSSITLFVSMICEFFSPSSTNLAERIYGWFLHSNDYILMYSLILGLSTGLRFGGRACIQHFSLRIVLWLSGLMPRDYARFLGYATERRFIQKVGGRYWFIHRLLQDHFAGLAPYKE